MSSRTSLSDIPPFIGHAPQQDRPLGGYLVLMGSFLSACGAFAAWLRASGRRLPERVEPADLVHDVGSVAAQALVQRAAEGGNLCEQVGLSGRRADVLHRDPRLKLCPLGGAVPLRVHGHLVALAGKRPAQLKQPRAARLTGSVTGQGHCLLCYQGDLHGASPHRMYPSRRAVEGPGGFSEKKEVGRASTHADDGVERACVVGTTGEDSIRYRAGINHGV